MHRPGVFSCLYFITNFILFEQGGYMNAKKAKLVGQYTEDADRIKMRLSNIFDGVAIMVNGWTKPSADELKELMVLHGGTFHLYQMAGFSGTTHIIASNLPNVKVRFQTLNLKNISQNNTFLI